ncbi:Gfo/Idh/MocA family protein [Kineococcus gynurae]|uniref:Gfo/Idh/MocA family protein n=1 Tax=Kineococcus gynurae TaxID=452979 RepID=A0ABV5LP55_9ACTN
MSAPGATGETGVMGNGGVAPVRLVLVGAGAMGHTWLRAMAANPDVELVGIVDLDLATARQAAEKFEVPGVALGPDAVAVARQTGADAIVNVTVPRAHHPVTTAALFAGFPVLGEKPLADTLAEALSLAAAAAVTGVRFVISQSRRFNPHVAQFRAQADALGELALLTTEFTKAPRFGGFRDEMAHPLLVDMAIHQFDLARHVLRADPVSVYCEEFNPGWSWYAGAANACATFEMSSGARYSFSGSWCAPGLETSWNGAWRLSGARGSAVWDGDHPPRCEIVEAGVEPAAVADPGLEVPGSLAAFVTALRTGSPAMGEVHDNVLSLAMVEAATTSAATGRRVTVAEVLDRARTEALAAERRDDVRAVLDSWTDVTTALSRGREAAAVR